jgi:catechol 2,3-dioxygenase-like lactoylglutathione lyase family enzyme
MLAALGAGADAQARPAAQPGPPRLQVAGVRIYVTDLERSLQFYQRVCGFELVRRAGTAAALLRNGEVRLSLRQVEKPAATHYPGDAQTHVNFAVRSLASTIQEVTAAGFHTVEKGPQPTAIGTYVTVLDPSGNIQQMIELAKAQDAGLKPAVFNLEIEVTEMKRAREFYVGRLGFPILTEKFYPPTIPLRKDGAAPLVLQETATRTVPVDYPATARTVVQLGTPDLAAAVAELKVKGVEFLGATEEDALGRFIAFKDPFGNVFELVELPREVGH